MLKLLSSMFNWATRNDFVVPVNALVNRSGDFVTERCDGRVLKVEGTRALVCWPKGEKTAEYLSDLVMVQE